MFSNDAITNEYLNLQINSSVVISDLRPNFASHCTCASALSKITRTDQSAGLTLRLVRISDVALCNRGMHLQKLVTTPSLGICVAPWLGAKSRGVCIGFASPRWLSVRFPVSAGRHRGLSEYGHVTRLSTERTSRPAGLKRLARFPRDRCRCAWKRSRSHCV